MRRAAGGALAAAALVSTLSACGSESDAGAADPVPATTSSTTTTARTTTTAPTTTTRTAAQASSTTATAESTSATPVTAQALMPAVVCMNLQDAQNLIQEHGVFYSRSTDATGRGRNQVLDVNWIVVAQKPAVGVPISEGDAVLSVVKIGEPNPC
ncbi:MAG: hypothetical protein GX610_24840 [Rhodococcus sp.]|nr:hypothetical protein [Rhodococcus sp. (in: high G+C Gram-positive bacteria)]